MATGVVWSPVSSAKTIGRVARQSALTQFRVHELRPLQIEARIVGEADDRFYAQKGTEGCLYVLPRAAFVIRGNAILANCSGVTSVWIPSPHDAPEHLSGASAVTIICLSGDEEDRRCEMLSCTSCRNHECIAYDGPQGHGTPSWHTLPTRGKVALAWTFPDELRSGQRLAGLGRSVRT
ncbi:MAG: hypothetical protein ABSD96_21445 [Candidatus Korobacteraceae bacterium]|jgi:hypothetical protein